jgi:hypothetical protein
MVILYQKGDKVKILSSGVESKVQAVSLSKGKISYMVDGFAYPESKLEAVKSTPSAKSPKTPKRPDIKVLMANWDGRHRTMKEGAQSIVSKGAGSERAAPNRTKLMAVYTVNGKKHEDTYDSAKQYLEAVMPKFSEKVPTGSYNARVRMLSFNKKYNIHVKEV